MCLTCMLTRNAAPLQAKLQVPSRPLTAAQVVRGVERGAGEAHREKVAAPESL